MTTEPSETSRSFFVAGGTVPPGSPSYVERAADRELYEALLAGEFCYVLNSRQMGKSSLAVRMIAKLNEAGVRTAFVDLTRVGGANSTPEQWYAGLLFEVGRALGLRTEAAAWLRDHRDLGPAQRLFSFLHEAVLARVEEPVVVMIDEIDAVRSLPFTTDELFAGLRELHNGRASDPSLGRLTVCLLGAALPSDLIRDPRTTPFNVGRRIELRDFRPEEARPFSAVVGESALARVLHWTGGHPFLTQSLCAELASALHPLSKTSHSERGSTDVDSLVRSRYLDARARETDTNLADVGRRLLGAGDPGVTDEDRATTLALYERVLKGRPVADDESNPAAARIKMSGVARVEGGNLLVRNRIYREAFGRAWVRENTPGQELRRQRRAFWKGVLRSASVAATVVGIIGYLALNNYRLAKESRAQRDQALFDAYASSMQTMFQNMDQGDRSIVERNLDALSKNPARGWEWSYWRRQATKGITPLTWDAEIRPNLSVGPRARTFTAAAADRLSVYDASSGRKVRSVELPKNGRTPYWNYLLPDEKRALLCDPGGRRLLLVDLEKGRVIRSRQTEGANPQGAGDWWCSPDGRWTYLKEARTRRMLRLDLETLEAEPLTAPGTEGFLECFLSPAADLVAWIEMDLERDDG